MLDAIESLGKDMLTLDRWPFWATVMVFTVIGQFTSTKLFTRERAYKKWPKVWQRHLWWWGRETLMLHPIFAGGALGLLWRDPEGRGWSMAASPAYFAAAGVLSMFAWALLKGALKKRGIVIALPGASEPPPNSHRK